MATATEPAQDVMDTREFPFEFAVVDLDAMFVDSSYQRPLTSFVKRIVDNFDPALIGTLVLSERDDGRFAIVDGQTRWAGMSQLHEKGMITSPAAPAVIFIGLSRAQEAKLFAKLQKERRGIASFHRFRAALVGGEKEAKAINKITEACGYKIGIDHNNEISAVAALEKLYRQSPEIIERVLVILYEAWKDKYMPNGEVLRGMGYFLGRNEGVDDDKLARRLSIVPPNDLKRRASALREGMGHGGASDKYMAGAIEGVYRRRGKR